MAPWIKMTWQRGLGEQSESLVTPERSGKALCAAQASVRGEMHTLLPGRVVARSGRRCDTSGTVQVMDQSSHMSSQPGALGGLVHRCLSLPAKSRGVGLGMLPPAFLPPHLSRPPSRAVSEESTTDLLLQTPH